MENSHHAFYIKHNQKQHLCIKSASINQFKILNWGPPWAKALSFFSVKTQERAGNGPHDIFKNRLQLARVEPRVAGDHQGRQVMRQGRVGDRRAGLQPRQPRRAEDGLPGHEAEAEGEEEQPRRGLEAGGKAVLKEVRGQRSEVSEVSEARGVRGVRGER